MHPNPLLLMLCDSEMMVQRMMMDLTTMQLKMLIEETLALQQLMMMLRLMQCLHH